MLFSQHSGKIWKILGLLVALSALVVPHSTMAARSLAICPAPSSYCIDDRFGGYWQEHGGLPIFGLPISASAVQPNMDTGRNHLTQWFERNRLELHEQNARPYNVLLGRLGVDRLNQQGRSWQSFPKASPSAAHYFAETGHAIAHGPFWNYWSTHGLEFDGMAGKSLQESLALFGFPLSEPAMETNSSGHRVLTQWFERARFEDHGANGVLLGLLGNEVRGTSTTPPPPAARLKYLWPTYTPGDLTVYKEGSFANETMWMLHLAQPHARQPDVTLSGGMEREPAGRKVQDVTIRGSRGEAYANGSNHSVLWREEGKQYAISGERSLVELLRIAENLEALDRATWERRLGNASESRTLKYFWIGPNQHELSVLPNPHGGSFADRNSFKLNLYRVHSRGPDVTISGGAIVGPPQRQGQTVRIRGQEGTAFVNGIGYTLVWKEQGEWYMVVSDLSLPDLLDLAGTLEQVSLETFRDRLQPE